MIEYQAIILAQRTINPYIKQTALYQSQYLSKLCNGGVFLKLENQQITNSFKIRGAYNKLLNLTPEEKQKGVITASSGNHAQAVAVVATQLNIPAKIIVPINTPINKLEKIRQFPITLELFGNNYDESENYALMQAKKLDLTYVSAYNDKFIIAGQGTIGLEILFNLPSITDILVPLGGGGLLAGIAIAAKNISPKIKIYGIQTEACPAFYESLKAGKIVDVKMKDSIADGMYGGIEKGSITFDIIKELVDEVFVVKEKAIRKSIALLWSEDNIVAEGAAASAITPILENKKSFKNRTVVSVITGGNIDSTLFDKVIQEFR
ncbi:MAG TPA: threonine/serine dehydratase [Candidatus Bathyarchaeia archaeon]|nr:threonine/serine dehydratase [Candidatus Bathyarchaeia archaeon]